MNTHLKFIKKLGFSQRQLLLKFDYRRYATNRSYLHWILIRTALLKISYNRRYTGYKASTPVRKKETTESKAYFQGEVAT